MNPVGPFVNSQIAEKQAKHSNRPAAQNVQGPVSTIVYESLSYNFSTNTIREALAANPGQYDINARSFAVAKAAKCGRDDVVDLLLSDGPVDPRELDSAVKKAAKKGHTRAVVALLQTHAISVHALEGAVKKAEKFSDGMIVALLKNELSKKAK